MPPRPPAHEPDPDEVADELIGQFRTNFLSTRRSRNPAYEDLGLYYEGVTGWSFPEHLRVAGEQLVDPTHRTFVTLIPPGHSKPVDVAAPVTMGDGTKKPLGEVVVGDYVLTHLHRPRRVEAVHEQGPLETLEITTASGHCVRAAPDHPFLSIYGWLEAGSLAVGTKLAAWPLRPCGHWTWDPIVSIAPAGVRACRCLSVAGDRSFIAGDLVVHNTTLMAIYGAWCLGRDRNERIIVATHTEEYSTVIMNQIEAFLSHPFSVELFGSVVPSRQEQRLANVQWTTTKRTVRRSDHRLKDPSMLAVGVGSATIGYRCSLILADDIVNTKNSASETLRNQVRMWYWQSLDQRVDPGGHIRIFGSRFFKGDLYEELIDAGEPHVCLASSVERPLWPERFGAEHLARVAARDHFTYQSQFLQDPVDLTAAFLKEEWLTYYLTPPPNLTIYMGVDPSNSGAKSADYMVLVRIGVDQNQNAYLLDLERLHADIEDQAEIVIRYARMWKPVLVGIESFAAQSVVAGLVRKTTAIPVYESANNLPQELRIMQMGNRFKNQKVLLPGEITPSGGIAPHPMLTPFIEEWRAYPTGLHDDTLNALQVALETALEIGVEGASVTADRPRRATNEELLALAAERLLASGPGTQDYRGRDLNYRWDAARPYHSLFH
jgi:hypothetical protein